MLPFPYPNPCNSLTAYLTLSLITSICLPTYLCIFIIFLPSLPTCTYTSTFLPIFLSTYLPSSIPSCLTVLLAMSFLFSTCLPIYVPTYLSFFLPTYLPTCEMVLYRHRPIYLSFRAIGFYYSSLFFIFLD